MWEYHDPYHPAANELYHGFKYIKRIMGPNGKWRYYYGDKATHNKIANATQGQREGIYSRFTVGNTIRRAGTHAKRKINRAKFTARRRIDSAKSAISKNPLVRNVRNNATRMGYDARNSLDNARTRLGWAANKAKRKFNTAKFVAGNRVESAKSAARDAFNNAKGAARNARNNAIRRGVDARNNIGNAVNRAARTASNWTKAKITTAVQKRARRRKGWNG